MITFKLKLKPVKDQHVEYKKRSGAFVNKFHHAAKVGTEIQLSLLKEGFEYQGEDENKFDVWTKKEKVDGKASAN